MAIRKKTKRASRRQWSKDDLRTLKSLAKEKRGAARIARILKRTIPAVRSRASSLGVSLDSRP
jgi:hypothetical protein